MVKATVHIGIPKTGTTSIQDFLAENADVLKNHKIAVPHLFGARNHFLLAAFCADDGRAGQFPMPSGAFGEQPEKYWKRKFARRLIQELKSYGSATNVVFSSEHLASRLVLRREIERLHELLSPFFEEISIELYLRRQDRLAQSRRSTALKAGFMPECVGVNPPAFYDFKRLLDVWSEVFGRENIKVHNFDRLIVSHGSIVQHFAGQLELLKDESLVYASKKNESLTLQAQQLLRLINKHLPPIKNLNSASRNRFRQIIITSLEQMDGDVFSLTRSQAKSVVNSYRKGNEMVAREWFAGELFDDDFSYYPEHIAEEPLSVDQYEHLIVSLCGIIADVESF